MSNPNDKSKAQDLTAEKFGAQIEVLRRLNEYESTYNAQAIKAVPDVLNKRIKDNKESLVGALKENISETLNNQLEEFMRVEQEILEILDKSLTEKYLKLIGRSNEDKLHLFTQMKLITGAIKDSARDSSRFKVAESIADVGITLVAALTPFYFSYLIGTIDSPFFRYVLPIGLLLFFLCLKVYFRISLAKSDKQLREDVSKEFEKAKIYVPEESN